MTKLRVLGYSRMFECLFSGHFDSKILLTLGLAYCASH